METMVAFCGLACNNCPIHLATIEEDTFRQRTMRESIAEQCSKYYGMNILPDDVMDCDGCCADTGKLFSGCFECEIRKCAIVKNLKSCAFCDEYGCARLEEHFKLDPGARERLEQIRKPFYTQ
jgi:hypothetical protein